MLFQTLGSILSDFPFLSVVSHLKTGRSSRFALIALARFTALSRKRQRHSKRNGLIGRTSVLNDDGLAARGFQECS